MTALSRCVSRFFAATSLVVFFVTAMLLIPSLPVLADSPQQLTCEGSGGTWSGDPKGCHNNTVNGPTLPKTITNAINILLFIIGIAAVIVIVIQAFRFVNSNGDASQISKSRNGIIFALIGLVVAALAYAIVNFVLDRL